MAALLLILVTLVMFAEPAGAHLIGAPGAGWREGFLHPFSGLDHQLAMIAVGMWAAQHGRRALWLLPLAFSLAMALGALASAGGLTVPGVGIGVAGSVAALGLLVALAARPNLLASTVLIACFAVLHGHVHGSDLASAPLPIRYGVGFLLGTLALHAIGIGAGLAMRVSAADRLLRAGGAAICAVGCVLVATAIG
jgi:urease accessory protein